MKLTFNSSRLVSASVYWPRSQLFAPVPGQIRGQRLQNSGENEKRKYCRNVKKYKLNRMILTGGHRPQKPFPWAAAGPPVLCAHVSPPVGRKCLLFPPAPHITTSSWQLGQDHCCGSNKMVLVGWSPQSGLLGTVSVLILSILYSGSPSQSQAFQTQRVKEVVKVGSHQRKSCVTQRFPTVSFKLRNSPQSRLRNMLFTPHT